MNKNNILDIIINKCNNQANNISHGFLLENYTVINNKFIEVQGSIYQNSAGKKVSALFDINGNEIIPINDKKETTFKVTYENNNHVLIEYYKNSCKQNNIIEKLVHYKYDDKTNKMININSFNNDQELVDFYKKYEKNDKTVLAINIYDKTKDIAKKQLYSIKKEGFISPKVDDFELINENDERLFFSFIDTVYSYDTYNGEKISTSIRGAITNEGELFNRIYVDYDNSEKICELNNHENFMQYRALKNHISRNLDIKIARLIDEQRKKDTTYRNYMVKVKKFYTN